MRIGHYMHGLWAQGGIASYLTRVSQAQQQLGYDVVFFDSSPHLERGSAYVADGDALVAAAIKAEVDVLHLHFDPPGGLPPGVPAVRTVHGHQPYCPSGSQFLTARSRTCERRPGVVACGWGHLVDRCGSRRPARLVDDFRRTRGERRSGKNTLLVAISEFVRSRLLREGYDADRVRVLSNPGPSPSAHVDTTFGYPPRFLFMGRIVREKGLAFLVEALARTEMDCSLDIAGSGPEKDNVSALIDARGLASRITTHDWLDWNAVASLIAQSRAVMVPSLWPEPAGMVAIEAAIYGRATIASAVGGLPEIVVAGTTGLLVPPGDIAELARSMDRLAADPAKAAAMGAAARTRGLVLYSLDGHLSGLSDIYKEVSA